MDTLSPVSFPRRVIRDLKGLVPFKRRIRDGVDAAYRMFTGKSHLPPYTLRQRVGGSQGFEQVGPFFLGVFRKYGMIMPGCRMLDVGCGCGRVAITLAADPELKGTIRYTGMDVDAEAIKWCQKNLTRKNPEFSFYHVDMQNTAYNPRGKVRVSDFVFPHPENEFDFISLVSVFSNLGPEGLDHYFQELHRILKPGGAIYTSFFTYRTQAEAADSPAKHPYKFKYYHGDYALVNEQSPETAIAYNRDYILALAGRMGLTLRDPITEGFQEVMIFTKKK